MLINQIIDWNTLTEPQKSEALMRPAVQMGDKIASVVREVVENVRERKDDALREYSAKFDRCEVKDFLVTKDEFDAAEDALDASLKAAMVTAVANIEAFHKAQKLAPVSVQTMAGITCEQVTRPIESVGLYIPGGTAPLFSTALMLLVPAKIAGCKTIELCSPPPIAPEILYACRLCGVERVYKAGGAQAIAAMAFGTQSIGKVDKIFGPGNAYVTEAKRQVSQVADGAAIDMPAGPSEVLVIADAGANPAFVAADLLSQAEHGKDSQVV
ncbi:MAG TPA: histidinol dehydrogenase, partial [Sutterella sp.]|nr:histidinol dehydrogenase [Sutterella sp.]